MLKGFSVNYFCLRCNVFISQTLFGALGIHSKYRVGKGVIHSVLDVHICGQKKPKNQKKIELLNFTKNPHIWQNLADFGKKSDFKNGRKKV